MAGHVARHFCRVIALSDGLNLLAFCWVSSDFFSSTKRYVNGFVR